jgi:hypothetical protein
MTSKDPILMNVKRQGLSLDFALGSRKITGFSIDYQESSKTNEVAQVMTMIDGVVSKKTAVGGKLMEPILEGIAYLSSTRSASKRKDPTVVNVKSTGLKMDLVLRNRKVTGVSIDYQNLAGVADLKGLIRTLDRICSGELQGVKSNFSIHNSGFSERHSDLAPHTEQRLSELPRLTHRVEAGPYDKVVVDAVENSLQMLGSGGRAAILGLLENRYGMRLQDVPANPRGFIGVLHESLGSSAESIEREIINQIKQSLPVQGDSLHEVVQWLKAYGASIDATATVHEETESPVPVESHPETKSDPVVEHAPESEHEHAEATEAESTKPESLGDLPKVALNFAVKSKR